LILIRDRVESLGPASLEHVRESGCSIITLGFTEDRKSRLALISEQAGDNQLILGPKVEKSSDKNGDVTQLCRTIANLLLSRYNITYYTPLREGKTDRRIEVLVPGRDCTILAQRSHVSSK
jgi:hypothetical protein